MKKITNILYQPYKWLVAIPFFILSTLIFGTITAIVAFLINAGWPVKKIVTAAFLSKR